MRKKQDLTKEEAMILLQSQPLNANLWQLSNDNLKANALRFPDPSYLDSLSWPVYMKENRKTGIEKSDQKGIQFNHEVAPVELKEEKTFDTEPKEELTDQVFVDLKSKEEFIENEKSKIELSQITEEQEGHIEEQREPIPVKKTKLPSQRKVKQQKAMTPENEVSPVEDKKEQEIAMTSMDTKSTSMETLDFYEWLEELKVSEPGVSAEEPKGIKQKPARLKPRQTKAAQELADAKTVAENSLKLGEEIVSETLARLLARQGHKEDAVEMYHKLILKYPEKEATFAAAIQKLKS